MKACVKSNKNDANDCFTTGDAYDEKRNTVSPGGIANFYDCENHLAQQGGETVVYDAGGGRALKLVAGLPLPQA